MEEKQIISIERTESGKELIFYSFKSKNQSPTFMVIKEYYNHKDYIEHAEILFKID